MPNITLKGVPVKVYRELKRRAAAGRRSLNSEAILRLEESLARPGDAAADGSLDLSDAISVLTTLFLGGNTFPCGQDSTSPGNLALLDWQPDGAIDITKADIIVSAGRGVGDPGKLPVIEACAKALGGLMGCSRPLVDQGWLPRERAFRSSSALRSATVGKPSSSRIPSGARAVNTSCRSGRVWIRIASSTPAMRLTRAE